MKRRASILLCVVLLLGFAGCGKENSFPEDWEGSYSTGNMSSFTEYGAEDLDGMRYESDEADISEDETTFIGEGQKEIKPVDPVEKNMLIHGDCGGNLGFGWFIYTISEREDQDYKIYFFTDQSTNGGKGYRSFEEIDFNLEQADFIFPDARDNNIAIGKFIEMYLFESFTTASGEFAIIVIATYETDGKRYYDTRIYTLDEAGYGYILDESMTEKLNTLYADVEEYPVSQIIEMPHD